jgi:dTDP-4-amino-4,6-dideoxygalactose transaminase
MRCDFEDARAKAEDVAALYVIHYAGFPQDMAAARQLANELGVPVIEDCALALLSRDGEKPLGSFGDVSVFCLYKTIPVPNGGLLLARGDFVRKLDTLPPAPPPPIPSTASHLIGSLLSNLELRTGEVGRRARQAMRDAGRWFVARTNVERVSTGTQHFNIKDVHLGMSAASHLVLRNQDFAGIVERRRRNYFLLYAMLRDVAPPVTGELKPGVCPLFYPMPTDDKAAAMARLLARGVETVDFWRVRHPAVPGGAFPEVDRLRERVLELPVHQDLSPADAEHVASCVRELLA